MALKGHGDPRWLVEERDDGKNVNNWHWTETDFSGWAKNRTSELLSNISIETDLVIGNTTTVETSGDVSINTRKNKTILFYELNVNIKWKVSLKDNTSETTGSIEIPYISEENDDTDFEIKLTVEEGSKDGEKIKESVRKFIVPLLKQKIPQMLSELREVALGTTKLQLKQAPTQKLDKLETKQPVLTTKTSSESLASSTTVKKSGIRVLSIKITEKFICGPVDLFQCFVELNRVRAYSGGDAQVSGEKGGKFSLFGGAVEGENVEVVFPTKLVQKWRFSSWPVDHYSTVTIELEEKNGKTILTLKQEGIPEDDKERTESGWKENFFKRIKGIFGFGPLY